MTDTETTEHRATEAASRTGKAASVLLALCTAVRRLPQAAVADSAGRGHAARGCSRFCSRASKSPAAFLAESPGQWWMEWAAPWICCQLACSGMCGAQQQLAEHGLHLREPERVLGRTAAHPVGHDAGGGQLGGEFLPEQLDGAHGAFRAGHREEARVRPPGSPCRLRTTPSGSGRSVTGGSRPGPVRSSWRRPGPWRAGGGRGGPGRAGRRCRCRRSRRPRPGRRCRAGLILPFALPLALPRPLIRACSTQPLGTTLSARCARRGDLSILPMSS